MVARRGTAAPRLGARDRGGSAYAASVLSPRSSIIARAVGVGLAVAAPVALLAAAVRGKTSSVFRVDDAILDSATSLTREHPALRDALLGWQGLTQPIWLNLACTGVCVWVGLRHRFRTRAWWAFGTLMAVWGGQFLLKLVVQRARPLIQDPVSHAPGYSFPSGHAANTTGAVVVVVILLWPLLRSRGARVVAVALGATVVLVTAADRVLLGVHYPSDVVGGLLVGGGTALVSWLALRHLTDRPEAPGRLGADPDSTTDPDARKQETR